MKYTVFHGGKFGDKYFWFSDDAGVAASYGNVKKWEGDIPILDDFKAYEITLKNPFKVNAKGEYYLDIPTPKAMKDEWQSPTVDTDGICDWAVRHGYDGAIIKNVMEGHGISSIATDYVCFSKEQFRELYNNKTLLEQYRNELKEYIKANGIDMSTENKFIPKGEIIYMNVPEIKTSRLTVSEIQLQNDKLYVGTKDYMKPIEIIDKASDLKLLMDESLQESLEEIIRLALDERLEKIDGGFITTSAYDIVNLLKNKPKDYRILYDNRIKMYMIGDANNLIHHQLMERAFKQGYYYSQENFMKEFCGGYDTYSLYNYQDLGQSGYWDGEPEENFDSFLWYIVFSPKDEWTLGTDGYDKRYDYPFGHVFTRGCDLSEIDLWDALGVPQNSEKIDESISIKKRDRQGEAKTSVTTEGLLLGRVSNNIITETEKNANPFNDNFWNWFKDSKMVNDKGEPIVFYHGTNKDFDKFEDKYLGKRTGAEWSVLGHFFTTDEKIATKFTKGKRWASDKAKAPKGAKVMAVYLNITNPLRISLAKIISTYDIEKLKKIREDAIKDGYDGIIIGKWSDTFKGQDDPTGELSSEQVVAFYPNQIKSVNNKGSWSKTSDNIYETLNKLLERYL